MNVHTPRGQMPFYTESMKSPLMFFSLFVIERGGVDRRMICQE